MSATMPITPRGLAKLHQRLRNLKEVERPTNVRDIEEARAHGDLKENAEYHAAKERQSHIVGNIQHVESLIGSVTVIDPATLSGPKVRFGATVTLVDLDSGEETKTRYQIVGDSEGDLAAGLITISSPVARALIGKEEGDEVAVATPRGRRLVLIEKVEWG
ncbi:MAG: transcription elongation factor GreA [Myxococcales bacterium]|nr:transcription elongation factor GreA [Myxococcales bacterium]